MKKMLFAAGFAVVSSASAWGFGFNDIKQWLGDGTNRCAVVVDFNDGGTGDRSFAWGYRWNGDAPNVKAILDEITVYDTRLKMFARSSDYGTFIDAFAYDADGDGGTFEHVWNNESYVYDFVKSDADDIFPATSDVYSFDPVTSNHVYTGVAWMQLAGTGTAFDDVVFADTPNGVDFTNPEDGQWICWRLCPYESVSDYEWNPVGYECIETSPYIPVAAVPANLSGVGKITKSKTKKGQTATWKAVASAGSVFSHWEGGIVETMNLSANARRNPTLKFKMPAKLDAPRAVFVPIDDDDLSKLWLEGDLPLAAGAVVTNLYLSDDSLSYVTATVTGLPSGMTFNAANLTFGGTPAEDGVYNLTVTAKNASGYQMKQALRLVVGADDPSVETPEVEYTPTYPLTVVVAAGGGGTASGTGVYAEGKTVTVKAVPAKNRVFAGWFEDSACTIPAPVVSGDYRAPTAKVCVPDVRYLFAKFLKKGAATDPVSNVACDSLDETGTLTMMVGVKLSGTNVVTCDSASLPNYAASGLPAGVSLDKTTGAFTGAPGKVGTFKVKVTASNASTKKALNLTVKVLPLPAWAKGTFTGLADQADVEPGLATLTVGATGKISGKVTMPGTNWTISASSFDAGGFSVDQTNLTITGKATYVDAKKRKSYREFAFTVNAPTNGTWNLSSVTGTFGDAEYGAHRHIWGDSKAAKTELEENWTGTYRYVSNDGDVLKLKVTSAGAVTWTGALVNGRTFSGSTTLLHEDAELIRSPFAITYAPAGSEKVKSGKNTVTVNYPVFCDVLTFRYYEPPTPGSPAERW